MNEPNAAAAVDQTPLWFPHQMDAATDRVALLRLAEEDYRRASFLDQRVVAAGAETRLTDWGTLSDALSAGSRRDAQYIFHIGNVGSTLISRLLGELPSVFALREPLLLRSFFECLGPLPSPVCWSEAQAEARIGLLSALLSRTFRPEQRANVKATSFTSEIAWRLVPPGSNGLFLFATPQHYVENILAGQNSLQTLEMLGPSRLVRLQGRCPGLSLELAELGPARKATLAWACEMTSLEASAARLPEGTVLWQDFDAFLTGPAKRLFEIARHFGASADPASVQAICTGPLMTRYSKALEYEFTPQTRREVLAEARWAHGPAIRDALGWLGALAARYPAIGEAIRRTQRGS